MNKGMKIKELRSSRLILRKFTKKDLEFIKKHFQSKSVNRYLFDNEPPSNDADVQKILDWVLDFNSEKHVRWGIALKDKPEKLIGTCGFHCYDQKNNSSEIGYDLSEIYHRKGYMSEALNIVTQYGFDELLLHKITAVVYTGNIASNNLLSKLGFRLEGINKDKHYFRGKYYDHNIFSLIRN